MAIEVKRGCGYRKVGGTYLIGGSLSAACDRLPLPLRTCPVCGGGIKVGRAFTEIDALRLFGYHGQACTETGGYCPICLPNGNASFLMMVGEKYYPTPLHFLTEGVALGVCKRIPFVPKKLKLGKTWIYLAHKKACKLVVPPELQNFLPADWSIDEKPRLLDADTAEPELGIIAAFRPTRIERLFRNRDKDSKEVADCEKRGIKPVFVPDGDPDHDPDFEGVRE